MNLKDIKPFLRKLLPSAKPTTVTADIYRKLPADMLAERTFYFGRLKMKARCLAMESAPGTAETVTSLLQSEPQGTSILDFGCGQHKSAYLRHMGFAVHSCDMLPLGIEKFTRINPAEKKLPFADKQFDVTVISEVVEHVWSPWELMEELQRVTRRRIVMTTPNPVSAKSKSVFVKTNYFYWFEPKDFSYHMTPVFFWQVSEFCKTRGLALRQTLANHSAFSLNDRGDVLGRAEALIYDILFTT